MTSSPFLVDDPTRSTKQDKSPSQGDDAFSAPTKPHPKKTTLSEEHIPVTILTGYLGAGKTTIITNLMKQMPTGYKIAWLKNEMGNTAVDTTLAESSSTATVKEMLQGCICHVMVGQLADALDELIASDPDRIIIETSGSATPAPVVWNVRNHEKLYVDGVVTVVDAKNFSRYLDKSPSLRIQAKYTDLILINKHEGLSEAELDQNLDDLYDINLNTPKVKTDMGSVPADLVFGLDSSLFLTRQEVHAEEENADADHHQHEVDIIEIRPTGEWDSVAIKESLETLPKTHFYRIKGVLRDGESYYIINCAFGECAITHLDREAVEEQRMVFMGESLSEYQDKIADLFQIPRAEVVFTAREHRH